MNAETERVNKRATRGSLFATCFLEAVTRGDETEITGGFWTLGRVTMVGEDGSVTGYRRFGEHFVRRDSARDSFGVGLDRIDMQAIASDMAARLAKVEKANEFEDFNLLNAYVRGFLREKPGARGAGQGSGDTPGK
jgi:hypothetical protein